MRLLGSWMVVGMVVACGGGSSTRLALSVEAAALRCDHFQLQVGTQSALSDPLGTIELQLSDDLAGTPAIVQAWCLAGGSQTGYATVTVTPIKHATVHATLTLGALSCGQLCTAGATACANDGVSTCTQQRDGCLAFGPVTPCPANAPFCSAGVCAATCSDECSAGTKICDGTAAVEMCGQYDSDPCLDLSGPIACGSGETCSAGVCGKTTPTCGHDGDACDDGNACTTADVCDGATCAGTPLCTTAPANADPTCTAGTCGFTCHAGYTVSGGTCVASAAGRVVFLTSISFSGNLGGLTGADALCQTRAMTASLPGTFKAWLADATGSPSTRMTHPATPYHLVDGTVVAASWTGLTSGSLAHLLDEDEAGKVVMTTLFGTAATLPWTNVTAAGTLMSATTSCTSWTSALQTVTGAFGNEAATDATWTAYQSSACDVAGPIICVQQ